MNLNSFSSRKKQHQKLMKPKFKIHNKALILKMIKIHLNYKFQL